MIGRYTIIKRLGAGSMGEVFLAEDVSLARRAALKLLGSRHLHNETLRERFLREARALARLNHPNLITIYEAGYWGEPPRPYFAMELLEGGDTQALLEEQGPLSSSAVATIGAQAAAGLGEAAHAGIIHRDVKPSNLGISGKGVLKVTDFSLAKSLATEKSLTGKGMVVGTADYIAPEQARGEELDERADVYALGCTMFHLLTGKPPYRAQPGTEVRQYIEVMKAHLSAPIPDPLGFAPTADPELVKLIGRMMTKDREKRPTFAEAARELSALATRLQGELPRLTRRVLTFGGGVPVVAAAEPSGPSPAAARAPAAVAAVAGASAAEGEKPRAARPGQISPKVLLAAMALGLAAVLAVLALTR